MFWSRLVWWMCRCWAEPSGHRVNAVYWTAGGAASCYGREMKSREGRMSCLWKIWSAQVCERYCRPGVMWTGRSACLGIQRRELLGLITVRPLKRKSKVFVVLILFLFFFFFLPHSSHWYSPFHSLCSVTSSLSPRSLCSFLSSSSVSGVLLQVLLIL